MSNGDFDLGVDLSNKLKQLEDKLILHYIDAPELFLIANYRGSIQYANRAWEQLGYVPDYVRGHLVWQRLAHPDDMTDLVKNMVTAHSQPLSHISFRTRRMDGKYALVSWNTSKFGFTGLVYAQGTIVELVTS